MSVDFRRAGAIAVLLVLSATPVCGGDARYVGEPISLSLRDADLVETLRTFAEIGGFNLLIQPGVSGTVTVELKNVPWDQALEQILKIHGLGMEVTGGGIHIGSRQDIAALRQRLAQVTSVRLVLEHAAAVVVARAIARPGSGILTSRGAVEADASANQLTIRDTGARLMDLGRLLAEIDVPSAEDESPEDLERRCLEAWREIRGR